jgi:hypothetical protein
MKRIVRLVIVFVLVTVVIACICVFDRAVLHFLGWDGQTSDNYAAWSGSVPAIATILGMSTLITGLWHHINCRAPGCLLVGHYPDSRGVKWCGRHHPDHKGQRPTMEMLHRLHHEHVKRQAGAP